LIPCGRNSSGFFCHEGNWVRFVHEPQFAGRMQCRRRV
jgi:hypothetical protein